MFLHWAHNMSPDCPEPGPGVLAAWAAARLTRACAEAAFSQVSHSGPICTGNPAVQHGRSTTTTELISALHGEFSRLYESETFL